MVGAQTCCPDQLSLSKVADRSESLDVGRLFDEHAEFLLRVVERLVGRRHEAEERIAEEVEKFRDNDVLRLPGVALVVSGKRSLPVADGKLYRQVYDGIHQAAVASPVMKKYHDLGTAEKLSITLEITNSKLNALEVNIYDPSALVDIEDLVTRYLGEDK